MSNKPVYKTTKKYKCPYCDTKDTRPNLIDHVENEHNDLIPEGYTSARAVYDSINGKNYGICMICKEKVYKWNPKINRYYNLCDKKSCRNKVRENALERHIKVYNKPSLLDDPEQQEKMLANRSISGTYTFNDGGKHTYTGKYEKNALEFMDKVLEIPSADIQSPGPVLEYEYDGKKHIWITDIYYIPANLLIEVKDGGSNPNNRSMISYREKQIAKEKMVTELGTFNYIRLTNNDFAQLLDIFADMKNAALVEENPKARIHINEEVGGIPPHRQPEVYIIPCGMNNTFDSLVYSDSESNDISVFNIDGDIKEIIDKDIFEETYNIATTLIYNKEDTEQKIKSIREYLNTKDSKSFVNLIEALIGKKLYNYQEIILSDQFKYYDKEREDTICRLIENGKVSKIKNKISLNNINNSKSKNIIDIAEALLQDNTIIEIIKYVSIHKGVKGFYATTPDDFYTESEYFDTLEDLKSSDIVNIMNDIYISNAKNR